MNLIIVNTKKLYSKKNETMSCLVRKFTPPA